jgi:hypothetical protein
VLTHSARLEQTAAQVVAAGDEVEIDQGAAGLMIARRARVRDSAIGILITPRLQSEGIHVLMGPRAGLAFGAGLGLVLGLFRLWRRRESGR